ncbi:DsrE family protein [Halorussus ruber]|uniref:DsrE family protein n=1 Tax=Halorussus ruber TaxID=1126238 RepID=UPI001092FDB3|nr:DsrE family protein [Halorussus ruber]
MTNRTGTRRRFLRAAGTGTVVALAGCTGDGGTTQTTDQTTTDSTPETTETTETTTKSSAMNAILHFSGNENQQSHAVANAKNLLADETTPIESVALVANGDGVLLLTADSNRQKGVAALAEEGVSLLACENSLQAKGLTEDDLLAGVETVPAGVGELVKRQDEGYAYIKVP